MPTYGIFEKGAVLKYQRLHQWFVDQSLKLEMSLVSRLVYLNKSLFTSAATMVSTMAWNDNTNLLAAIADSKFTVWYYPNVAFVDSDILPKTMLRKDQRYVFSSMSVKIPVLFVYLLLCQGAMKAF